MATTIEYALMAGASYIDTRLPINRFPIPDGWATLMLPSKTPGEVVSSHESTPNTGFEAIAFKNTANPNQIVISFAGTYDIDINGDQATNLGLGLGIGSPQLIQAAAYYLQVRKDNPDATITLTGHSLGGGLAALVGVFFGVETHTFDQAPFANTAQSPSILNPIDIAANLRSELAAMVDATGTRLYDDAALVGLTNFLQLRADNGGIPNAHLVTNINVQGEVLSSAPFTLFNRIGTTIQDIANSANGVAGGDLHSQALLTAMLQSGDTSTTTATDHTLGQVTFKLTDLLAMTFDPNLYSYSTDPTNDKNVNFLEHLVRHQAGNAPMPDGSIVAADKMVERFTADLWKLAQDGGLTMSEGATLLGELNNVNQALIAFAMQKYYEENNPNITYGTELFTDLSTAGTGNNGIQFDMADVSKAAAAAISNNQKIDFTAAGANQIKGYALYFQQYLNTGLDFTTAEKTLITSLLPYMRDWYVQAGMNGMTATDTLGRNAFTPYSLTLAEDKNLFEVLGGSANDAEWRIAA